MATLGQAPYAVRDPGSSAMAHGVHAHRHEEEDAQGSRSAGRRRDSHHDAARPPEGAGRLDRRPCQFNAIARLVQQPVSVLLPLDPLNVGVDHHPHELGEVHGGRPAQPVASLAWRRPPVGPPRRGGTKRWSSTTWSCQSDRPREGKFHELLHRVGLARGDHVVVGARPAGA